MHLGYYDHAAQTPKAHDAWRSLIEHRDGMLIHWAATGLLRDNFSLSVVNGSWHYPEAKIARAYVLAVSSNDSDQQEALRIYDDLRGDANTWFLRHLVIQIPLLLRKADLAQIQCKNWLNQDALPEIDYALGGGEREAIRQITTLETFSPADKTNSTRKLFLNFQSALIAHSLNPDAEAIHLLDRCRGLADRSLRGAD